MDALKLDEAALAKYITTNPGLLEEIKDLSPEEQKQQILWAFEDEAEDQGIEPWELAIKLVAQTPEEQKEMHLETHKQVAQTLEMDWAEYRELNSIDE